MNFADGLLLKMLPLTNPSFKKTLVKPVTEAKASEFISVTT